MSVVITKVPVEVVVREQEQTELVCDQCGATVKVGPFGVGKDSPDPTGWMVLKSWDLPPWYDLECKNHTVRHFDSVRCLSQWASKEQG